MGSNQQNDLWSISLGRWGALTVRLHMVFLLFAVVTLFLCWSDERTSLSLAWISLACLLAGVLIHELGHVFATRRMGKPCDEIVLWPFGGVSPAENWRSPREGLAVALAGPGANLLVCLACFPVLGALDPQIISWGLLQPFQPEGLAGLAGATTLQTMLRLLFWINWVLFLANLIPAHPFDGGHALYHYLSLVWPKVPDSQRRPIVARTGQVFAVGLVILGFAGTDFSRGDAFALWLPLSVLAIFVFFSARHFVLRADDTERETAEATPQVSTDVADLAELDEDDSLESLDETTPLEDWIDERQESTRRQREEIEADEEQRVDDILARLHETGMDGLSRQDREFLERVSARYRNRQESR